MFGQVKPGERISFDDGCICGVIVAVEPQALLVEITEARRRGSRLRADQGINLPDTALVLPALTQRDRDRAVLPFVARHTNSVTFSYVQSPADVEGLHVLLCQLNRADHGLILKIETRQAFDDLPAILLSAMASNAPLGVMIARGDLVIECGWERLAELQAEILRFCEAAHLPCIWATQVLEELAHHGIRQRMHGHQHKTRSLFRRLELATNHSALAP
ncbi:pyruvate kinase [Synechococcus sp. RedBA-s]|uniref:pyruvate kinase n=1 Tax=Synechococcus sp. RedBA-s TaxID=2823741 RepID=UPI0020CDD6BD|nr:pyruvate kinase [Synechococcus sp. RedBA-s]MCP9801203.1 hypothetical protein [Synechococcus sp. RedBA-s]